MKNKSTVLFGKARNIGFSPVNTRARAMVWMSVVIAITTAFPIAAILKGSAKDVSHFGFYIEKRQWLADSRTIFAGIHYLYESCVIYCASGYDTAGQAARPEIPLL